MKVIYCIAGIFNSGGMERVLSIKTNYLVSKGYDVTIITTDQQNRKPFFFFDSRIKHIDLDINYMQLPSNIVGKILNYKLKQLRHYEKLKNTLKCLNADIVISMFDHDVSLLHKINDKSKKICEIHFSRFKRLQYGRKGLWKFIDAYRSKNDERLAGKYDRFVVLTKEDASYWSAVNNVVNIPNPNTFNHKDTAQLVNKKVIAVGRLDYQKGFDDLIKSWSLLNRSFVDWSLHIYGSGPLQNSLSCLIDHYDLKEKIFIHPPVSNIVDKYLESSILVMTSRYEGLPMTLLEAQVCGLPLVSYTCKCGPKDLIDNGVNGYLVEEGNINGISAKLQKLMADDGLRTQMGIKSKEFSANFSEEVVMSKWESLFKETINE